MPAKTPLTLDDGTSVSRSLISVVPRARLRDLLRSLTEHRANEEVAWT
jgi:hypothetical protein